MRALVLDQSLHMEMRYPNPTVPQDEALVRVRRAGICATDLQMIQGYMAFSGILGHEFVGVVEQATGREDLLGARVVGEINASCQHCSTCRAGRPTHCPNRTILGIHGRNGAFADYLCLPIRNLHVVPAAISDRQAIFIEPLAAACQILDQISVTPKQQVVVIGDGKLGLLCAQVLKTRTGQVAILGRHPEHLAILSAMGIATALRKEDLPGQADIVIEATGHPEGLMLAMQVVRPQGTIVLKSTYHGTAAINMTPCVVNELCLIGSRCGPFHKAIEMLQHQQVQVDPLYQAEYPLDRALDAIDCAGIPGSLKVVLNMET
ncbi:MAG: alcohol dehydrogenase [Nitrospirae bacterium]|nr:MAG: alcohol dehydrogenase [Nitrospirota bacterium]